MVEEKVRLEALRAAKILDTAPDEAFDRFIELAGDLFEAPIALISLVDEHRQWFKARRGLEAQSTPREWAFCDHTIARGPKAVMVVEDATADPRFAANPLVTGEPNIRFYTGAAVTDAAGNNLGTLCVIDAKPRSRPTDRKLAQLRMLADMVAAQIESAKLSNMVSAASERALLAADAGRMGIWEWDFADDSLMWDARVYALFGLPLGAPLTFDRFGALVHPDDIEELKIRIDEAARTERRLDTAFRIITPAGLARVIRAFGQVRRDEKGVARSMVGFNWDITHQVAQEQALKAARAEAEAAAAVKSEFLANMSHEIRTPLTAIIGFSGMLEKATGLDDTARRSVDRIRSAGEALLSIVNDVLDFSKLEAGQFEISPHPVHVCALAEETLALFTPQASAKGLGLAFDADEAIPDLLLIDADRVRQVLLNLIGNAMKFTAEGRVGLSLRYDAALRRLKVKVADTGPGMSAEQQAKLFQRFSQVDASSTRNHGGTGLGLAICKGLAEAMGGGVSVQSQLGMGSVFTFEISAAPATAPEPVVELGDDFDYGLTAIRVLVVDDNPVNRELASVVLTSLGAEVADAASGAQGVQKASEAPYDVILLDVRMPDMSGEQALQVIRGGAGPNSDIPILAFTAEPDFLRTSSARFDGYVGKPIVPADLASAIISALVRFDERAGASLAASA